MLTQLTLIFVCQLIGELVVVATGLPVPGPVLGMALLFVMLVTRGGVPAELAGVADSLIRHLSLLFVPAGVGVMLHLRLIGEELAPISIALVVSTVLAIGVTGALMALLGPRSGRRSPGEQEGTR